MRQVILLCVVLGVALPGVVEGREGGAFGLGVIVGEPTGIDAKLFLSSENALEAAVAWSVSGNNDLHLQMDYLYHRYEVIKVSKGQLPLFFGVGGRVIFREDRDFEGALGGRFYFGN